VWYEHTHAHTHTHTHTLRADSLDGRLNLLAKLRITHFSVPTCGRARHNFKGNLIALLPVLAHQDDSCRAASCHPCSRETIKLADREFRFRTKVNRMMRLDNRAGAYMAVGTVKNSVRYSRPRFRRSTYVRA